MTAKLSTRIEYLPRTVKLPRWARFVAIDADGGVFAYRHRPHIDEAALMWTYDHALLTVGVASMVFLGEFRTDAMISCADDDSVLLDGWRDSLVEIAP